MTPISRILAAIDFSEPARRAFDYALALSAQHSAELAVVLAVPPREAFDWHAPQRRSLIEQLRQRANQAQVAFTATVQHGDAAETILRHAQSLQPDLIVAGALQRRGIDRLRTASIGERLAVRSAVPVLLVPSDGYAGFVRPFGHLAVAVDFSASSERAIGQALSLASGPAQRVTLLHVVSGVGSDEPTDRTSVGIVEYQDQLIQDDRIALMRIADARLRRAVAARGRSAAAIDTRVVAGAITTALSQAVGRIGADLLVVGVPTRGAVSTALFGTTAGRLLRVSPVPMLAVPQTTAATAHEAAVPSRLAS